MNKRKILNLLVVTILCICLPYVAFAHSGRTDSAGGHHDYQNKSGLGNYHYHHGYGPHLHPGGMCPYQTTTVKTNEQVKTTSVPSTPTNIQSNTTYTSPVSTTLQIKTVASSNIKVYPNTSSIYVGGVLLTVDNFNYNGNLYVPLRAVSESLSSEVDWNNATKTANITNNSTSKLTVQEALILSQYFYLEQEYDSLYDTCTETLYVILQKNTKLDYEGAYSQIIDYVNTARISQDMYNSLLKSTDEGIVGYAKNHVYYCDSLANCLNSSSGNAPSSTIQSQIDMVSIIMSDIFDNRQECRNKINSYMLKLL